MAAVVVVVAPGVKPPCKRRLCFLPLAVNKLAVKRFQVKIGLSNEISIAMFKKLHFQEVRVRDHGR